MIVHHWDFKDILYEDENVEPLFYISLRNGNYSLALDIYHDFNKNTLIWSKKV